MMATITTTSEADLDALDLPELQEAIVAAVAELQGASQDKDSIMVSSSSRVRAGMAYLCLSDSKPNPLAELAAHLADPVHLLLPSFPFHPPRR